MFMQALDRSNFARSVYIVDGMRTPWLKVRRGPGNFSASDLAVQAGRYLLARQTFTPDQLDEVVTGCVIPSSDETNISRVIALRLSCGKAVPAYTVQRNCASGMQALDSAALDIACGRYDLVLAGGTEAMSQAPLLLSREMTAWFAEWNLATSFLARFKLLTQFKLKYLNPVIALLHGLTDPIVGLSMGQTAEVIAHRFGITREEMDKFALQSHQRLAAAQDAEIFKDEINPIYDKQSLYYSFDNGLRRDTNLEKLASLTPFFDKPFGLVTAGNSSQVTDGAAFLILASEEAVKKYQLPILARIVDVAWAGVDPSEMGLGPVHAVATLLKKQALTFENIDFWEINEAFAGQVLACLAAWQDTQYCKKQLGLTEALGKVDQAKLNIDGGAVAMGHPVGASGARLVLHLAHILKRKQAHFGVATLCIGGGQGGALLLENIDKAKTGVF
ncbi:MAG: acetyl-CoA C-acetyltransferase [Pseudomonadota bacterium]|jgi:acetyl-CoA C-acetyltransferase|nr:acetyl-CoA C-acetyltransferase [Pseudomonadota bacterium]